MIPTPGSLWVLRMVEERFHRDDEGRPLREGRTPPEYLRPDEIDLRPCPYPGSRHDARPMNVSALRQTSSHWDEIVGALGFLRNAYADGIGRFVPDVMDVWRVSQLGSALPWFFVLRGEPLPAYAAALSKATLGTGILAQRLIQKMLTERWMPPALTTDALRALAESTGTLVGEAEVCAAPDRMIGRFLDVLVAGAPGDHAGAGASLEALRARGPEVIAFGACYAGFKLAVWLYYQARRFLYADVIAARPGAAPAMHALLRAPCEPPDFFVIEPPDPAIVPPVLRAAWLGQLAALIVPFAPDGRDAAIRVCADQLAAAMAAEAAIADPIARARATFARLDELHGALVACVESGLRGGPPGAAPDAQAIDADVRDRLMAASPRAAFAAL